MQSYKQIIRKLIKEVIENNIWYHGTPDVREIEKNKDFSKEKISIEYVSNLNGYENLMHRINQAREQNNMDEYFKLLDNVKNFKKTFIFNKPLFVTNKLSVAKTYANPKRSFDYQNAKEKILKIKTDEGKTVTIKANGDRFKFINKEKVIQGFINSGIDEKTIRKLIKMFAFYIKDKNGIKTNVIAAIAKFLDFDFVDVIGVLDSYEGGNIPSTVRIILNPSKLKIIQ